MWYKEQLSVCAIQVSLFSFKTKAKNARSAWNIIPKHDTAGQNILKFELNYETLRKDIYLLMKGN